MPSLVVIGPVVLEKKIFKSLKVFNLFLFFPNYLPFGKGLALHFNKLESPSSRDTLCHVWLKLAQWFWSRRWKCEKFTDGQTDRWRTTGDQKSSLELSAQVSFQLRWAFSSVELKTHNLPSENWVKTWIHFIHQYFVPDLVVISPVVLKRSFGISCIFFYSVISH